MLNKQINKQTNKQAFSTSTLFIRKTLYVKSNLRSPLHTFGPQGGGIMYVLTFGKISALIHIINIIA